MPRTVTNRIKELLRERDARITSGTDYVQGLLQEVRREVIADLAAAPAGSFTGYSLKQTLSSIERYLGEFESSADREVGSVISDTYQLGAELLPATAQAAGSSVYLGTGHLAANTVEVLKDYAFGKIKSVSGDLYTKIKGELTLGILGQKTPQQVANSLAGALEDKPIPNDKWGHPLFRSAAERAEVITGLETGRAFSIATQMSIEGASDAVPGLQKMWLHAGHPRTPREVHLLMHGQTRSADQAFYTTRSGEKVMYPRDPNAPISEVIRCG